MFQELFSKIIEEMSKIINFTNSFLISDIQYQNLSKVTIYYFYSNLLKEYITYL